jgi:peptidoglycan hydrolase CwlO-like protein
MNVTSLRLRRSLTLVIAAGALMLGFAAVRAASAWTAEAAPLVVSPTAASAIESRLAAEQARSAELEAQITAMTAQADEMTAALRVAQDRITADGGHADQLAKDLAAAKARLKKLEASIKAAAARRVVTVVRSTTSSSSSSSRSSGGEHEDEHEHEGGDDDD